MFTVNCTPLVNLRALMFSTLYTFAERKTYLNIIHAYLIRFVSHIKRLCEMILETT